MESKSLVQRVREILHFAGFETSEPVDIRPRSFDFAARRDDTLILLKCISNVDSLDEQTGMGLRHLARHLLASPLIVGEKSTKSQLVSSVVYMRYGVPVVNIETLYNHFVEGVLPLLRAEPGGLYATPNPERMSEMRKEIGVSFGNLARMLGLSSRTVRKYEEERMKLSLEVVLRLEELFGEPPIEPIDILEFSRNLPHTGEPEIYLDELKRSLLSALERVGLNVIPTVHSPFTALCRDCKEGVTILSSISRSYPTTMKRAEALDSLSKVVNTESMVVVKGALKRCSVGRTALILDMELQKVDDSEELLDLMHERVSSN
ncbi:MAG: transcriptional regulator [Methermicoccaceae archaeon]